MNAAVDSELAPAWDCLAQVPDPEIPAISIVDLGIVRGLHWSGQGAARELVVTVTPTYSGCPATEVIAQNILAALAQRGFARIRLEQRLAPAWTTDWLSPAGRAKLTAYGIAPPAARAAEQPVDASRILRRAPAPAVACPRCGSRHSESLSEFGSTPCKALHRCRDCGEPFDYFKPH